MTIKIVLSEQQKWHLRGSRFLNFLGENTPRLPLVACPLVLT